MAYSPLGVYATVNGANGGTTGTIDTTGATLLVVSVANYNAAPGVLTDSKSNTWTALTGIFDATTSLKSQLYYCKNPTVGAGHTFTLTGTGCFGTIIATGFSGADLTTPFDVENGGSATAATTVQPGNVTPGATNELIITMVGSGGVGTHTVNSGFTLVASVAGAGSINYGCALAYLIETSIVAQNPTWTLTIASGLAAAIATFKAAAVAGGILAPRRMLSGMGA